MNVRGIGIDLVEVSRIESALARHGPAFLDRIFTAGEQAYCRGRGGAAAVHYAARFAAKEAVAKALGCGIGARAGWLELEVVRGDGGAPGVRLHGAAAAHALAIGVESVWLSLTHTRGHAAAQAVAVGPGVGG